VIADERNSHMNENVVPDSIEPLELWRAWFFEPTLGHLVSLHHSGYWLPGVPVEATCAAAPRKEWTVVPWSQGVSLAVAQSHTRILNKRHAQEAAAAMRFRVTVDPPLAELPDGFGYALQDVHHDAPDENCTCGIYAATDIGGIPSPRGGAYVVGKVKLWGKVIPGENGARAQYAYPSLLYANDKEQAKALAAYGVPVERPTSFQVLGDEDPVAAAAARIGSKAGRKHDRLRAAMLVAAVLNLAACFYHAATF